MTIAENRNNRALKLIHKYICNKMGCSLDETRSNRLTFVKDQSRTRYVKILSVWNSDIVKASPDIYYSVKDSLEGKSRDELYESQWVYGQTIHFIPHAFTMEAFPYIKDFDYRLVENAELDSLYKLEGFDNALGLDMRGRAHTCIALYAKYKDEIAAIAGASYVNDQLREIGVDVKREYRGKGLGSLLVRNLTVELLNRELIPFYSASSTNLISQTVAIRCGYFPYWTDSYGTRKSDPLS